MTKGTKKRRVRLKEPKGIRNKEAFVEGTRKSRRNAPRTANGKIMAGYSYKQTLEGYKENDLTPTYVGHELNRRPMFAIQPSLAKRIVKLIRKGYPYTTVCRAVGIHSATFKEWLEKGKAGYSDDYIKLYRRVAKAEASAEMRQLKSLRNHEKSDWRVSAWQLERRWPEHWSKKDRVVAEMHVNTTVNFDSKENLTKTVNNDDSARELARKMIDGSEYGYEVLQDGDS